MKYPMSKRTITSSSMIRSNFCNDIAGMSQTEFSIRRVAGKMVVHHSVIDCLMQRLVNERPRSDISRRTTPREDKLIAQCARRNNIATSARIRN